MLNGAGVRTRAIFKVYVGSLYVPAKATTAAAVLAKGPRRIQLNMLRDVSSDQMVDALIDGLNQDNTRGRGRAPSRRRSDQLVAITEVDRRAEGRQRRSRFDFVDGATRVSLNGAAKGTIAGRRVQQALTNVWIGDKPVQDDLKKAMLGG